MANGWSVKQLDSHLRFFNILKINEVIRMTEMGPMAFTYPPIEDITTILIYFNTKSTRFRQKSAEDIQPIKVLVEGTVAPMLEIDSSLTITGLLQSADLPVYTFATGINGSFGQMIFACGKENRRIVLPETVFRLQKPQWTEGKDLAEKEVKELKEQTDMYYELSAKFFERKCGLPPNKYLEACEKGKWLNGQEIVNWGFASSCDPGEFHDILYGNIMKLLRQDEEPNHSTEIQPLPKGKNGREEDLPPCPDV